MVFSTETSSQELLDLIYKDELTKIYNRRFYNRQLSILLKNAKEKSVAFSYIMIDVDHFKGFNDTYGHEKGDEVLATVARIISEISGKLGLPIRYAGDEFVILLPGISKIEAVEIAEKIRKKTESEKISGNDPGEILTVTLSVGVATFPEHTDNPETLHTLADDAAYISKKKGRNKVSTCEDNAPENLDASTLYRYFPCKSLIGRQDLMDRFIPMISPGQKTLRPIIVMRGPSGIGKSRIIDELYDASDKQRCFPIKTQAFPYTLGQPLSEILEPVSEILKANPAIASSIVSRLDQVKIQLITLFLPFLSRYTMDSKEYLNLTAVQRKSELIEGFKEVLLSISEEKPLLIFFDEFHYSNLGTRLLLGETKSDPRSRNIALFSTVSDSKIESNKNQELESFYNKYGSAKKLEIIDLKPFDRDQVAIMADKIINGLKNHTNLIEILYQVSGGNPGKIENNIKNLIFRNKIGIENGVLKVEEILDADMFVKTETESAGEIEPFTLDDDTKNLLAKASVIGSEFNLEMLKRLDSSPESYIYDILEKAEKADIISRSTKDENDVFEFRNDELKENLYKEYDDNTKQELHRLVGCAEKDLHAGDTQGILSKLAYHFEKAGDTAQSLAYLSQLSQEFQGFYSPHMIEAFIGKLPEIEDWGEEKSLSHSEKIHALRICKRLLIALKNLDTYPEGTEIVQGSLHSAYLELKELIDKVGIVSFADSDGILLINNEAPSHEEAEEFNENEFLDFLETIDLKGLSFRSGLEADEFKRFLHLVLSTPPDKIEEEGGWKEVLKKNRIENAQVNLRVFVTLSFKDLLDTKRVKKRRMKLKATLREDDKAQESENSENLDKQTINPEDSEKADSNTKDKEHQNPKIEDIEVKIKEIRKKYASDRELNDFLDKIEGLTGVINDISENTAPKEKEIEKPKITPGTASERNAGTKLFIPEPGDISHAPDTDTLINPAISAITSSGRQAIVFLEKVKEDTEVLIEQLDKSDIESAKIVGAALLAKGKEIIDPLVNYLTNSNNLLARKTAILILKRLEPSIDKRFIKILMQNTTAAQKENIINILKDFNDININPIATLLLRDPSAKVRRLTLSLMEKNPQPDIINIIIECLDDPNEEAAVDAAYCLGRIGNPIAVPHFLRIIKKKLIIFNDGKFLLQEAACKALGQIGGETALFGLGETLRISPQFFLRRNKPPSVRAAATFALGYFQAGEARGLIENSSKDPSPVVRSAANLALAMISKKG